MSPWRQRLAGIWFFKVLSSLQLTVVCLLLLLILTFWGTVAQIHQGLYVTQERFFHSFFFLALGFFPFPGAQLVLWILFFNLVSMAITRFIYRWQNLGILVVHFGLLTYFVAAYVTLHGVEESQLTLKEGQSSDTSADYRQWELSVWKEKSGDKKIMAYNTDDFSPGKVLDFSDQGFTVTVEAYFANAQGYTDAIEKKDIPFNISGIEWLKPLESQKDIEKNIPGGIFQIETKEGQKLRLLLFGAEEEPTPLNPGGKTYYFLLRHRRYPLPVQMKLVDFLMERHPQTDIARSYESKVSVQANNLSRDVLISMNKPFRFKNYTFYQASYSIDPQGQEYSTFAVVRNAGRLLPYISSLLTFAGLVIHFGISGLIKTQGEMISNG